MTKNIYRNDAIHQPKNIMMAWLKRALPVVTCPSHFDASGLLRDEPHPFAIPFYQKNLEQGIKLNHNLIVRL